MRCFALLALISATTVGISSALVDASKRTIVYVGANAYDEDDCGSDGCTPEKTRDGSRGNSSRWSCKEDLEDEKCKTTYEFEEPQDIRRMRISFYKGDERTRKLKINLNGETYDSIESSGTTTKYETFTLNSDETETLSLEARSLDGDEWISIKEVQFLVK